MSSPIRSVEVVSTGTVAIRPEHVASSHAPLLWWLLTSRRWTAPRPINVYVVEHEQGLVLFDTGQDRASVTDPHYFPKGIVGWLYGRLAKFQIGTEDTLPAALARSGHDIGDVRYAILSHLHQDHIGGLAELRHAEIVVNDDEWRSLQRPDAALIGLMRGHIELPGLAWRRVSFTDGAGERVGEFPTSIDLFGDGSLILLSTPGHTPGSMSLLVRREGATPLLMVGDLTYDVALMPEKRVPGVGDHAKLQATTRAVNALRTIYPDLVILPAQDPSAADRLHRAEARN